MNYYEKFNKEFHIPKYQENVGLYLPGEVKQNDFGIDMHTLCLVAVECYLDHMHLCRKYLLKFTLDDHKFYVKFYVDDEAFINPSTIPVLADQINFSVIKDLNSKIYELTGKFTSEEELDKFFDFSSSFMKMWDSSNNKISFMQDGWMNVSGTVTASKPIHGYEVKWTINGAIIGGTQSSNSLSGLASTLPGVSGKTTYPCGCYSDLGQDSIYFIIIHLNDQHRWKRERIADWLDELADNGTIDIDFEEGIGKGDHYAEL